MTTARVAKPIKYSSWIEMVHRYRPAATIKPIAHEGPEVVAAIAQVDGRTVATWAKLEDYVPRSLTPIRGR